MLNPKFTSSNTTVGSQNSEKLIVPKSNSTYSNSKSKNKRNSHSESDSSSKEHKNETVDILMKINEWPYNNYKDVLSQSTNSYLNPKFHFPKNEKRIRAISESSTESNLSSNILSSRNFRTCRPTLFNNLKKLTNEKLILTANNVPISVFSRLAFRSNALK